jgi:hypothetical protein
VEGPAVKYLIIILCLLLVGTIGKDIYDIHRLTQEKVMISNQLDQSNLSIGRAQIQVADLQKQLENLPTQIQQDIESRKGKLTEVGIATLSLNSKPLQITSSSSKPTLDSKKLNTNLNLEPGALYQAINENNVEMVDALPFSLSDYQIQIDGAVVPGIGTYTTKVEYQLHLKLKAVEAQVILPSGDINRYLILYQLDENKKPIEFLTLDNYQVSISDQRKEHMFWWAPHIDVGVLGGLQFKNPSVAYGGSLGFSVAGYGLTKDDLQWKFLRVGLNLGNHGIGGDLAPFEFNFGKYIPFLSNLWVGPIVWENASGPGGGVFMSVGL